MRRRRFFAALAALIAAGSASGSPGSFETRADVRLFIEEMVQRHGFVARELEFLFRRARSRDDVLRAIAPPTEPRERSWEEYRARFVNDARIAGGLAFWARHAKTVARAEREYGVPEEIIVAIIGVETLYGRQTGGFRVVDSLATLAFDYPPRAAFFRSELEQYLLLARDEAIDVFSVKGSYAGAIGIPQFMPGSIRRYAVDFDGDSRIDLRKSAADAIGSVANFLRAHGWRRGESIWVPARIVGDSYRELLAAGIRPSTPASALRGVEPAPNARLAPDAQVALIALESPGAAPEYRLGLENFYVLTRYNRSSMYASAVSDLAAELRAAHLTARR
jgi:membrane-bound lytic murein transglycosylase B